MIEDAQILIVEDDEGLRELLEEEISDAGHTPVGVPSAERARRAMKSRVPDVVVSDLRLPGADGMDLLAYTRSLPSPPGFIMITAFGSINQAVNALKQGADDFLTKPLNLEHFGISISRTLESRRLRDEVRRFRQMLGSDECHGILGRAASMRALFDQIIHIARASGPILIVGESGVGKELVARALHNESDRSDGPFLAVNCAGVPSQLLESEFFGHKKGAFTGATRDRKGLFEQAEGGTILLDEIAEMPVSLQAKLLRVLQEHRIRSVGASRDKPVDVRIVAATNRSLERRMHDGDFRQDLYYRLETFQLRVPPLRERGDDVDLLAARFLEEFSGQMDKRIHGFSPDAIEALRRYRFPGNVRELKNAIERAVTFCSSDEIERSHLPRRIQQVAASSQAPRSGACAGALLDPDEHLPTLQTIEHRYIRHVLDAVDDNKRRASHILGISRRTLYRKLEAGEEHL